jgi:glyoxylate reductase
MRAEKSSEGGFLKFMARSPEGKNLGIFGLGSIGKQIAKRAKGFDMKVYYHNR